MSVIYIFLISHHKMVVIYAFAEEYDAHAVQVDCKRYAGVLFYLFPCALHFARKVYVVYYNRRVAACTSGHKAEVFKQWFGAVVSVYEYESGWVGGVEQEWQNVVERTNVQFNVCLGAAEVFAGYGGGFGAALYCVYFGAGVPHVERAYSGRRAKLYNTRAEIACHLREYQAIFFGHRRVAYNVGNMAVVTSRCTSYGSCSHVVNVNCPFVVFHLAPQLSDIDCFDAGFIPEKSGNNVECKRTVYSVSFAVASKHKVMKV